MGLTLVVEVPTEQPTLTFACQCDFSGQLFVSHDTTRLESISNPFFLFPLSAVNRILQLFSRVRDFCDDDGDVPDDVSFFNLSFYAVDRSLSSSTPAVSMMRSFFCT